jgi:hypothetical protein
MARGDFAERQFQAQKRPPEGSLFLALILSLSTLQDLASPGGLSKTILGFRPAGALRATKFAPGEFVEPSRAAARRGFSSQ